MDIKQAFADAHKTPEVQDAINTYNLWRDSKSNPLSKSTNEFVQNSGIIPQAVKDMYADMRERADGATFGLASSNVLTKGLRYQRAINKGIDFGLEASEKIAGKMNAFEDKVNAKIDDKVYKDNLPKKEQEPPKDRTKDEFFDKLDKEKQLAEAQKDEDWMPGKMGRYLS